MTLYDRLEDNLNNKDELTRTLIELDCMLKRLHINGYYIRYFDPKKIILYNGRIIAQSFSGLVDNDITQDKINKNIWQLSKFGIMAYFNYLVNDSISESWVEFLLLQIKNGSIKKTGIVPEDIYEYYEEIFMNKNYIYLYDYLLSKQQEEMSNKNAKVKKMIGIYGEFKEDDIDKAAFVNILFIPSMIALGYIIGLIFYILIIK